MSVQQQLAAVESQLTQASEAYLSGQAQSKPAIAKVKRLIRRKLALQAALGLV